MQLTLLKGKIHRATVTQCDLNYEGSISIDAALLERSGILPHEQVDVLNINSGERFTTYAIPAPAGSGTIGINGAAARLAQKGDLVIIVAYARMEEAEAKSFTPRVVLVDANNRPQAPALRVSANLKTI
jgi:aspartate 1-decarboxylase